MLEAMRSVTHAVAAVAVATAFPRVVRDAAEGRPGWLFLAVACALLPDVLERWRRAWMRCEVTVLPDPLKPDVAAVLDGIAVAARRAAASAASCRVRILPFPAMASGGVRRAPAPWIRIDATERCLSGSLQPDGPVAVRTLPAVLPAWPDRRGIDPGEGLVLEFRPGRTPQDPLQWSAWKRGWPHGVALGVLAMVGVGVAWGGVGAAVVAGAFAAHWALDQGGMEGVPWSAPFARSRQVRGWRCWSGSAPAANAAVLWVACLFLFWNLARNTDYLPWRPPLMGVVAVAALGVWAQRPVTRIAARVGTSPP